MKLSNVLLAGAFVLWAASIDGTCSSEAFVTSANRAAPRSMTKLMVLQHRSHSRQKQRSKIGPFVPWNSPRIVSEGDYRDEAYLERHIGGPIYESQDDLPRLPIPSLRETVDRFLPTALPLAESEDERRTLLEACEKFPSEAHVLQERLAQRHDEMSDSSWLQKWWNTMGYLQVRDPVAVHVSYFLSIGDDPTLPTVDGSNSNWRGIHRAAAALTAAAEFRKRVCSGQMSCDRIGKEPLCSAGYKYMFHSCRIPRKEHDLYHIYDPCQYKHCVVACRGHFFAIDFVDDDANPLPLDVLVSRLQHCVDMADRQEEVGAPQLGWLTGCDRDYWAEAREELMRIGGRKMEEALSTLESGAFLVCLDDERPATNTEAAKVFWHGNGSSGCNRWFDKSIQLICTQDGKISLMGEHSMFDGMSPLGLCTQIVKNNYRKVRSRQPPQLISTIQDPGVRNIFEECWSPQTMDSAEKISCIIEKARNQYSKLTAGVELRVKVFEEYGKSYIKRAGISPDAFLQLAMQLATYRLFGKQVATYEATQVRRFLHGRTETTRTVSLDSAAFVKRMGLSLQQNDSAESQLEKLSLLQKAVQTHHAYTLSAANGHGVDRHFLGLSLALHDGEAAPSLFSHPVYLRSKQWRLSTSSLPYCPGFGPVVPDGIGIGYGISSDSCTFIITARREHHYVDQLCYLLEEALLEMGALVELD